MTELYSRLSQFWEICVKFSGVFQFSGWMSSLLYSAIMFSFMISVQVSAEPANGYVGTTEQFVVNGESKQMVGYLYKQGQTRSQNVEIFVDKPRSKGRLPVAKVAANKRRADLKDLMGLSDDKVGFGWDLPKSLAFSDRKIYVYPEGQTKVLPSEIAGIDQSILLSSLKSPIGICYGVYTRDSDQFLSGWVYDENTSSAMMKAVLYVDAPQQSGGKFVMNVPVFEDRSKIARLNGFKRSDIGFSVKLPGWVRDSGRKIYLSCVLKNGKQIDIPFQKAGRTLAYDIAFQNLGMTRSAIPVRVLSWSPEIRSPRRVRALSQDPWVQMDTMTDESGGMGEGNKFWLVSTSMEDQNYSPVRPGKGMNALLPEDPLYQVYASRVSGGNYSLRMVMDKMTGKEMDGTNIVPTFLFGAINESFDIGFKESQKRPRLGDNLYVDLTYRLNKMHTRATSGLLPPKARISLGIATRSEGLNNGYVTSEKKYVEINLDRTESYDLCPARGEAYRGIRLPWDVPATNSDPEGIYDSRHAWGLSGHKPGASAIRNATSGGELVYYDQKAIRNWIVKTEMGDGWIHLRIPISYLMVRYSWKRLPSHWDAVQVGGIYLGSEIWGRGFLDWEVKELSVFSMKNEIN